MACTASNADDDDDAAADDDRDDGEDGPEAIEEPGTANVGEAVEAEENEGADEEEEDEKKEEGGSAPKKPSPLTFKRKKNAPASEKPAKKSKS
ncbi:hypothetical protein CYMTET_24356 [Cymbomonas tetramitiformis]|uniref:Uncharacterized protein n=1 Tax=Cymbomonas tetramitiformis TaxID=36881 RepID=A0AAE0FXE4_9CHLO|nr:hypothetical protein CYMTET_24356 [Cymbomonas tetramitiformis]